MSFKKKVKVDVFAYCGEHPINNTDPQLPEKGGTGKNGGIRTANKFIVRLKVPANPVTIEGVTLIDGCRIWAKCKNPGQTMENWVVENG